LTTHDQRLRFGVVGCGVIGTIHARAIESLEDARLVAVADIDEPRAERLGSAYGAQVFGNLELMLDGVELDVVNVCTPSGMHGEQAISAMRWGRHVIVEKPIEIQLPRIDHMLREQQRARVKLAVISQHRIDPASVRVHELAEQGVLGRLIEGNAHVLWWRSQEYYDSAGWRGTWALDGGGVLMNQSIHSIDLLCWFLGPVSGVQAYSGTLAHRMETEDVAVAVLRFASGALGTIAATTAAYPGVTTRVEIFGDKGSAIIENDRLAYLHVPGDDPEVQAEHGAAWAPAAASGSAGATSDPAAVAADTHALQIQDMIRAIREDGEPMVDGRKARHPVAVILAVYESGRTGREVAVSDWPEAPR
jgi:predicted dehydrogenase